MLTEHRRIGLWALVALSGCVAKHPVEHPVEQHGAQHWSYSGETSPVHWAELDAKFKACGSGAQQTPIDFPASVTPGLLHGLRFRYRPSGLTLLNNGHTVQANYDPGSHLEWNGETYELQQFHFHAHSEHSVAGKTYPLELHLVHQSAQGKLAVVGVFIEAGGENPALAPVFKHLPQHESAGAPVKGVEIDAAKLLPKQIWAYHYLGSLTTPPCTEGVQWFVLSEPARAAPEQIQAFTALYHDDFRPIQSQNGRPIDGAHFEYEGEAGPTHWGELSPSWSACETGKQQSPIDIPASAVPAVPADLAIEYRAAPLDILNNGHTVEVEYPSGSAIELAKTRYALEQFHFHAPSEHTIAGKTYPLELHLVHRSADAGLAVIALLIAQGAQNAALESVFASMPASAGPANHVDGAVVDAAKFLPASLQMWRYDGSLTTPPCSEHVKWHVLATPIEASSAQIEHFTRLYRADARPVQPLNERSIQAASPTNLTSVSK